MPCTTRKVLIISAAIGPVHICNRGTGLNGKSLHIIFEEEHGIAELVTSARDSRVHVERWAFFGQGKRKGRLADLPRADESHCGLSG